jgi:hypothetical protein
MSALGPVKRGLTHAEAIAYVGIKRRTFDEEWRPKLVAMRHGSCLIFDKEELDRLFDRFKEEASGAAPATDSAPHTTGSVPQNGPRNGRPIEPKGSTRWAKQHGASTPEIVESGKSTSGGGVRDFASAASAVLKKRNVG